MRALSAALLLAAFLVPSVRSASSGAAPRLDALLETRPTSDRDIVLGLLGDTEKPQETLGYAYIKLHGEESGTLHQLDETLLRVHPWQSPPHWYVAFRFADRRYGSPLPSSPSGDIELAAPREGRIGVGVYENAQAFAFQDPGRPGLSIKGECEVDGGDFEIVELHRDYVGHVDRLGATFQTSECRGFVAYRRGLNDETGHIGGSTPVVPEPQDPLPSVHEMVAAFAEDDPRLAELEIPDAPDQATAVLYARGVDWVGRGKKHLTVGVGDELEFNYMWAPERRVADLTYRRPIPGGLVEWWEYRFASPNQKVLAVGTYPYAGGFPYHALGFPGIRVAGKGRGCATAAGRFRVLELKRRADGTFERLAVDFEQHCETWGPALTGFMIYRAGTR